MPIYEYQCTECGELKEALQKMSDAPLTDCPACGKATLKKKISAVAFRLKGSGWYETDFKSGDKKNLADGGAGDGGSDGGGDGKSADTSDGGGKSDGATKTDSAKSDSKTDSKASKSDSGGGKSAASS